MGKFPSHWRRKAVLRDRDNYLSLQVKRFLALSWKEKFLIENLRNNPISKFLNLKLFNFKGNPYKSTKGIVFLSFPSLIIRVVQFFLSPWSSSPGFVRFEKNDELVFYFEIPKIGRLFFKLLTRNFFKRTEDFY